MAAVSEPAKPPSFAEALRVWARIGLLGFGGPAGQIALMHKELVERRRWISEGRFLHALSYCTLLPGPEAQQLATYIGWLLHGTPGGLAAGTLFVLPGFLVVLALSILYALHGDLPAAQAALFGLKAAVLAIVVEALLRVGKRALRSPFLVGLAAAAFASLFLFSVPFPVVVLGAAVCGFVAARVSPTALGPAAAEREAADAGAVVDAMAARGELGHTRPSLARAARVLAVGVVLWAAPIAAVAAHFGTDSVFFAEGVFFSKAAVVTFGGAYAVLAYVAQQAVEVFGWLAPGEMIDGLGLAETTPGPLILVLEFVGFQGAHRHPQGLAPVAAGILGATLTTWVTFVPCFIWIFLGAPWIESLRRNASLRAALSGITAAVVGVIANLTVYFALHVAFREAAVREVGPLRILVPTLSTVDVAAIALSCAAAVAMIRFRLSMPIAIAASAAIGAAWTLGMG